MKLDSFLKLFNFDGFFSLLNENTKTCENYCLIHLSYLVSMMDKN